MNLVISTLMHSMGFSMRVTTPTILLVESPVEGVRECPHSERCLTVVALVCPAQEVHLYQIKCSRRNSPSCPRPAPVRSLSETSSAPAVLVRVHLEPSRGVGSMEAQSRCSWQWNLPKEGMPGGNGRAGSAA